ncbi:MAG: single-stranded DNA-binding protein [Actinobacteria bacterium]|nr:single-stranded DNA-binding protein [Actinomycetota bacterium]
MNLAVLAGELSSAPEIRLLTSGSRLAQLQVRVPTGPPKPTGKLTSVPVTLWDPPGSIESLAAGDVVVVVGTVVRRFFRTGRGQTASRVEVVADTVARAGDQRRRAALSRRITRELAPVLRTLPEADA